MYVFNLALRFKQIANSFGTRPALCFPEGTEWSYNDLNAASDRIAYFLNQHGLKTGDVVAINGEKTFFTFAAILGCLKSGAAYTVFDPSSPSERLYKIFKVCRPKLIFGSADQIAEFKNRLDGDIQLVRAQMKAMPQLEHPMPVKRFPATTPAYIMFTSGSTGTPKGAVITHGNVLNFIDWGREAFDLNENERLSNVNPLYFDNSVFDFYGALFNGAALIPFDRDYVLNAPRLVKAIDRMRCTQWFSVPTMLIFLQTMKVLNKESFSSLHRIIFGGEGYPLARLKKLYDLFGERVDFYNVYGPTECTCICSNYKLSEMDFEKQDGFPPLGAIISNFSWLILDNELQPVAPGEAGELCLSGPNVGAGYFNDPDNTERNFINNPFNRAFPQRMYKTGDLVRVNIDDGKLYILGRKDNQVKHMGYRIELEEIENALCRLDYVNQATVVHGFARGLSRLVAVVCGDENINEKKLRSDLKTLLPDYMVPNRFHPVRSLPTNANGKVDRRRISELYLNEKRNAS